MLQLKLNSRFYPIIISLWFFTALVLGASGRLVLLRPPAPQIVIILLTITLLIASARLHSFHAWLSEIRIRHLIAIHMARFIGIYFLVLYTRGQLPFEFAVRGGLGDILVATGAFVFVFFVLNLDAHPKWLLVWNGVGLLDILLVVVTAARLALANPESMTALLRLPLSLLPTFLVPIIIATHIWIFIRLQTTQKQTELM